MKKNPSEIDYYAVHSLQVVINNSEEISARDKIGTLSINFDAIEELYSRFF